MRTKDPNCRSQTLNTMFTLNLTIQLYINLPAAPQSSSWYQRKSTPGGGDPPRDRVSERLPAYWPPRVLIHLASTEKHFQLVVWGAGWIILKS